MLQIKYLNKYGDPCEVNGRLDGNFIVQAHGNGWGVPFSRILKQENKEYGKSNN